jgi:hypothetical protein
VFLRRKRENITGEASLPVLSAKYYYGDQFNKDEMGGACSGYWSEEKHIRDIGEKILKKETAWKMKMGG